MDTTYIYSLLIFWILSQGHLCYPCQNSTCSMCPSTCVSCESEDYCYECKQGFYGEACSKTCKSPCSNNTCNMFSGSCQFCEDGHFLNDHLCLKCPKNCLQCTSAVSCSRCVIGYSGNKCQKICINCKPATPCDQDTGRCTECADGLSGQSCDTKCSPKCKICQRWEYDACTSCSHDRYGEDCNNRCPSNCLDATCNGTNGACTLGCSVGYWGIMCIRKCHPSCRDSQCDILDGQCTLIRRDWSYVLYPVVVVGGLAIMVMSGIIIYLKRREIFSTLSFGRRQRREVEEVHLEDDLRYERMNQIGHDTDERLKEYQVLLPDVPTRAVVEEHSEDRPRYEKFNPTAHEDRLKDYQVLSQDNPIQAGSGPSTIERVGQSLGAYSIDIGHETDGSLKEYQVLLPDVPTRAVEEHLEDRPRYEKFNPTTHEDKLKNYKVLSQDNPVQAGSGSSTYDGVGQRLGAHFIDGIDCARAYVICKDPKTKDENTEFWKMVWNERCDIIIMLNETDAELPVNMYCPEVNTKETCGDITVKTVEVLYKGKWVRRTVVVTQNKEKRQVFQVQWQRSFTVNEQKLIEFRAWVMLNESVLLGPPVIHSRDGVSRCGQYIALDMFLKQRESQRTVTMTDCIDHLRKQTGDLLRNDDEIAVLYKACTYRQPKDEDDTDEYHYISTDNSVNN